MSGEGWEEEEEEEEEEDEGGEVEEEEGCEEEEEWVESSVKVVFKNDWLEPERENHFPFSVLDEIMSEKEVSETEEEKRASVDERMTGWDGLLCVIFLNTQEEMLREEEREEQSEGEEEEQSEEEQREKRELAVESKRRF